MAASYLEIFTMICYTPIFIKLKVSSMWKDHPKYGKYISVSSGGEVFNKSKQCLIKQTTDKRQNNEPKVHFQADGKSMCFPVRRLVAETFCAKQDHHTLVLRKDKNPNNNKAENLYWASQRQELSGRTFGRLTVLNETKRSHNKLLMWKCKCSCGTVKYISSVSLLGGRVKSCGCKLKEYYKKGPGYKHGKNKSPEYKIWDAMIQRCHNPKNKGYFKYGERGIFVCERWRESFMNFYEDMGDRPTKDHTIERINNNKGYFPENCVWADRFVQANNTRRNKYYTYNSKTLTLTQWSRELDLPYERLRYYIRKGHNFETAVKKSTR